MLKRYTLPKPDTIQFIYRGLKDKITLEVSGDEIFEVDNSALLTEAKVEFLRSHGIAVKLIEESGNA